MIRPRVGLWVLGGIAAFVLLDRDLRDLSLHHPDAVVQRRVQLHVQHPGPVVQDVDAAAAEDDRVPPIGGLLDDRAGQRVETVLGGDDAFHVHGRRHHDGIRDARRQRGRQPLEEPGDALVIALGLYGCSQPATSQSATNLGIGIDYGKPLAEFFSPGMGNTQADDVDITADPGAVTMRVVTAHPGDKEGVVNLALKHFLGRAYHTADGIQRDLPPLSPFYFVYPSLAVKS